MSDGFQTIDDLRKAPSTPQKVYSPAELLREAQIVYADFIHGYISLVWDSRHPVPAEKHGKALTWQEQQDIAETVTTEIAKVLRSFAELHVLQGSTCVQCGKPILAGGLYRPHLPDQRWCTPTCAWRWAGGSPEWET